MLTVSFLPDVLDMGLALPSAITEAGPYSFLAARYFTMIFIVCKLWLITTVERNEDIRSLAPSPKEAIGIAKASMAVIKCFRFVFLSNACIIILPSITRLRLSPSLFDT